jgi:hypothetical protein
MTPDDDEGFLFGLALSLLVCTEAGSGIHRSLLFEALNSQWVGAWARKLPFMVSCMSGERQSQSLSGTVNIIERLVW